MTGKELRKLAVYCFNVDGNKFAKDVYGKDEADSYTREKFAKMQNNTVAWIGELDDIRLNNLAKAVNNK